MSRLTSIAALVLLSAACRRSETAVTGTPQASEVERREIKASVVRLHEYEARHPGVLRVGGSVTEPREVSRVKPAYPAEVLARRKFMTLVLAAAVITADGTVEDPFVFRTSDPELTPSILAAVRQWRYEPARENGRPVPVFLTITVTVH